MNEAKLRKDLTAHLRKEFPGAVVFSHEDEFTAGIPDVSITARGKKYQGTVWFELKHVTPKKRFKSSDLQQQTAVELSALGNCWYIVFEEKKIGVDEMGDPIFSNMTYIIHPGLAHQYREGRAGDGFNFWFVADFLREVYG